MSNKRMGKRPALLALAVGVGLLLPQCGKEEEEEAADLREAAEKGLRGRVEALLARGDDVNARDKLGRTLLHEAAENGHTTIVELLLTKGADPRAKNNRGLTPSQLAASQGHKDLAKFLRSKE